MKDSGLLERLKEYGESDMYPFHMPGHKRRVDEAFSREFPNPFSIDITEVDGFDNLHHPEGILKESMEWAAKVYGADRTYYLVNGSSCGILSAICGTTDNSDTILMSRNCHKSAYHGVFLNHLRAKYIYPQLLENTCVQGGLLPDELEEMLNTNVEISAVFVVSPTYDGIVSDIKTIANICHKYAIPLIVDEAHGAHFRYGKDLPVSALELGADVVIQSVHKTLPSFTQTALLHVKEGYVDVEKIERYLHIYQSSSPSYLFMAGIENCIRYMEGDGRARMEELLFKVRRLREELAQLEHLSIMGPEVVGTAGVYDLDITKLIISTVGTSISGAELDEILRSRYHLEMEMCTDTYVTAILSVMDTDEGLGRLRDALLEIDTELGVAECERLARPGERNVLEEAASCSPEIRMTIYDAVSSGKTAVPFEDSAGRISGEYIYVYPPGIPIVAPGEVLNRELIETVRRYQKMGLAVQGLKDESLNRIEVIKEKEIWEK